ncbi:deoxynucleoside monophosphate kinase [Streptomyces phage Saftant]|uniref:Deoxynucleoside monophosphate kinase n=1 Tax=Streptomyces phage Saftant TaxID=2601693 RepID=A0A5J6D8L9_9CAUD|nr:deoxynucleoside monophosphate kinase [Streptomyces phage Saftant]QEQ94091.1 deoxynucleoside monophosphate kinase [Streptomyces phage Saftant]
MSGPTLLIGLSGYAGAGKDEAAAALVVGGWRRDAFADRLRAFLYALDPWVNVSVDVGVARLSKLVDAYGWDRAKRTFPEVRRLLQRAGTEAGRKVLGTQVWVDALMKDFQPHDEALVVTDVRFKNEADAIREAGGVVVRIERPGVGPKEDPGGWVHESEVALDHYDFDVTVKNDGTIEELHDRLLSVTKLIRLKNLTA